MKEGLFIPVSKDIEEPALHFLQQPTRKLTYTRLNSPTCFKLYLGRVKQRRKSRHEVDRSSGRSTRVVLQRHSIRLN